MSEGNHHPRYKRISRFEGVNVVNIPPCDREVPTSERPSFPQMNKIENHYRAKDKSIIIVLYLETRGLMRFFVRKFHVGI